MKEIGFTTGLKKRPFIIPVSNRLTPVHEDIEYRNAVISAQVGLTETDAISKNKLWKSLILKHKSQIIQERKRNSRSNRLLSYFQKFCKITSLHGFHFLAERERNPLERVFWIIALSIVYICCALLIKNSIQNWLNSPAIISIENTPTPVGLIPFPAITVCGSNQIRPSVFNISSYFSMNESDKVNLDRSLQILNNVQETLDLNTFHYMFTKAHVACEDTFVNVKWTNETIENPCDYVQPVLTDLGLCYSFNMLPFKVLLTDYYFEVIQIYNSMKNMSAWSKIEKAEWSPENGYGGHPIRANDIPRRTSGSGSLHAFTISLDTYNQDFDRYCNYGSRGFTILIHSPAQLPTSADAKIGVSKNSLHWVTINPKRLRTSNEVKTWNPHERGCYFDEERQLYFFKIYTQSNCDLECESNYSMKSCGCVAFYHPRSLFTPICGSMKMDCIEDSLVRFAELYTKDKRGCDCLPSCTTLEYESDVMTIDMISHLQNKRSSNKPGQIKENITESFSTISISYQNRDTLGIIRQGLYDFSDFLGNIGGIMGLFLGFSWISLLEVMYFIVLRPIANNRLNQIQR